jgi:hypothetical protein
MQLRLHTHELAYRVRPPPQLAEHRAANRISRQGSRQLASLSSGM